MNSLFRLPLNATPDQAARLLDLQRLFAQACNALAPLAAQTRVWNRVALHHMAYKSLREQFPALGSQMVCNAIYSVSRTCRQVYQHPASRFNLSTLGKAPLPPLRFTDNCPVYFDRHTLSLRNGQLSLFTLTGRMHFKISLLPGDESALHARRLREIVLGRRTDGAFELAFLLASLDEPRDAGAVEEPDAALLPQGNIPDYVKVEETA